VGALGGKSVVGSGALEDSEAVVRTTWCQGAVCSTVFRAVGYGEEFERRGPFERSGSGFASVGKASSWEGVRRRGARLCVRAE